MKATMDSKGKITITPEDDVECYAIKEWSKTNDSGDIFVKHDTSKGKMGFNK